MKIKKCLSLLMFCVMLAEPFVASANQIANKNDNSKPSAMQFVKGKMAECNDRLDANPKTKKGLKAVGIGAAVCAGVEVAYRAGCEIWFNCVDHSIEGLEKVETNGDDIKKQEGADWCWNACLQRALHKYGIEKTQKEIFKGITDRRYVSPFKSKRGESNRVGTTRKDWEAALPWLIRMCLPDYVFNEEIKNYVEKVTGNNYTYQTLYIDWKNILKYNDDRKGTGSINLYKLYNALRPEIAKKCNTDVTNVVLLSLCPCIKRGHMVTIEDTRENKFIIGEPWAGKTVWLAHDKFFRRGPDFTPFVCSAELCTTCPSGFPISFIIKKGSEIKPDEWTNMIQTSKSEAEKYLKAQDASKKQTDK